MSARGIGDGDDARAPVATAGQAMNAPVRPTGISVADHVATVTMGMPPMSALDLAFFKDLSAMCGELPRARHREQRAARTAATPTTKLAKHGREQ